MKVSHLRALRMSAGTAILLATSVSTAYAGSTVDASKPLMPAVVAAEEAAATDKMIEASEQAESRQKPSDPVIVYLDPNSKRNAGSNGSGKIDSDDVEHVDRKQKQPAAPAGKAAKSVRSSGFAALISKFAKEHGVPLTLARAVVRIESNFNPKAHGSAGEIGLMQIKPATARGMGFGGRAKELYDPATNLRWGMKYLGGAHKLAGGDICGTILRYNGGHYAKRMNPVSARYCRKVQALLKSGGEKAYASI